MLCSNRVCQLRSGLFVLSGWGLASSASAQPLAPESLYPAHCQQSLQLWEPTPESFDLLVITAHPDDEGIFFGGALPFYSQARGKTTALIGMTGALGGPRGGFFYDRKEELERAAWAYGVRHQPTNFQLPDVGSNVFNSWGGRDAVVNQLATEIRRLKPSVILTHGNTGEYGHAAHVATSQAVQDAYDVAADAGVDLEGLAAWQPSKLYLHGSENAPGSNPQADGLPSELVSTNGYVFHSWEEQFEVLGNNPDGTVRSSRDVANHGLQCQLDPLGVWPDLEASSRFDQYTPGGPSANAGIFEGFHSEDWTLARSEVGPDTVDSDFFQNVGNPPVDPPPAPTLQPIPLINADFSSNGWANEEQFIQNSGSFPAGTNIDGWATDGLVRAYSLDIDGDGDPTTDSGPQVRTWNGWTSDDALIQIGFQDFTDPENALSQDAGTFEEGKEYQFSIDLAPGFENAAQDGFVQIIRASDGTVLAETTFAGSWNGSSSTTTRAVSYTATAADEGSAIRVRFGADAGGSGTSAFANPLLALVIPALPADLDGDGDVDDADFGLAFAAFTGPDNGPPANTAADLDNDGDVDDADFGLAFAAFTGPGAAVNVPEPTSLALISVGGWVAVRRRRS